MLSHT